MALKRRNLAWLLGVVAVTALLSIAIGRSMLLDSGAFEAAKAHFPPGASGEPRLIWWRQFHYRETPARGHAAFTMCQDSHCKSFELQKVDGVWAVRAERNVE